MKIIYQSKTYSPDLVTGVYVRCHGRKGAYLFRVYETTDGIGFFKGKPGMGPTTREYDCDGSKLPDELRERCIQSKGTEKWQ